MLHACTSCVYLKTSFPLGVVNVPLVMIVQLREGCSANHDANHDGRQRLANFFSLFFNIIQS